MTAWLLRTDVLQDLRARMRAGVTPSADQLQRFVDASVRGRGTAGVLNVAGDVAEIRVEGLLTPRPDFLAMFFGFSNTAYPDVVAALAAAASDPAVRRVSMYVDSPGGAVAGLFDLLAALEVYKKPITVRAALACSAAFAIAAVAGPITATNPAAAFGSIGVAASIHVDEDVIDIASTAAPNKRPDVTTDAGKAVVRAELDAIHELFVDAIARGRKTTVARVNADFGRGGVLLAGKAQSLGMIDKTTTNAGNRAPLAAATQSVGASSETRKMDIETLKLQYPAVAIALKKEGADEWHDTVLSHITLGEGSGDVKAALEDIKARKLVTSSVQSHHMSKAMNRHAMNARQFDSDVASAAVEGATSPPADGNQDLGDLFAASLPKTIGSKAPPTQHTLR